VRATVWSKREIQKPGGVKSEPARKMCYRGGKVGKYRVGISSRGEKSQKAGREKVEKSEKPRKPREGNEFRGY